MKHHLFRLDILASIFELPPDILNILIDPVFKDFPPLLSLLYSSCPPLIVLDLDHNIILLAIFVRLVKNIGVNSVTFRSALLVRHDLLHLLNKLRNPNFVHLYNPLLLRQKLSVRRRIHFI